jgi:hypothetical protein
VPFRDTTHATTHISHPRVAWNRPPGKRDANQVRCVACIPEDLERLHARTREAIAARSQRWQVANGSRRHDYDAVGGARSVHTFLLEAGTDGTADGKTTTLMFCAQGGSWSVRLRRARTTEPLPDFLKWVS